MGILIAALSAGASWAASDAGPANANANADAGPVDAGPAKPVAKTFAVDAKQSAFVLQVFKDGAAAAFAHDHTVHATEMSGSVTATPGEPEKSSVSVVVQTKSLVNDDPQVRRRFGLDPTVPEKDKKAIEESMKGESQLDVAKYPTISFTSTSVQKSGDKLLLVGDMTLHGVTKPIKMPVTVKIDGNTLVGDGKVRFLQSEYGIKPYSAFLGAVKNKDEVVLNVHLVAVAR